MSPYLDNYVIYNNNCAMYIYVLGDKDFKYCIFGPLRYTLPPFLKMAVVKTNVNILILSEIRAILFTLLCSLVDSDVNGSIVDLHQTPNYCHFYKWRLSFPYLKKYVI